MLHGIRKVTQDKSVAASSSSEPQLTVLESNSCLFCAKTFSTPACSAYVTNPNPLQMQKKKETRKAIQLPKEKKSECKLTAP